MTKTQASTKDGVSRGYLLALDPGTNNFAYALVYYTLGGDRPKGRVLYRGLIHHTLRVMNDPARERAELAAFTAALSSVLKLRPVNVVIGERYMLRRGSGGVAIETINQMIGIIRTLGLPTKFIPASQWKNATHRVGHDLDGFYKSLDARSTQLKRDPEHITVHEVDAAHIGAFGCCLLNRSPPRFKIALSVKDAKSMHFGEPYKPPPKKRKARRK